MEKEFSHLKIKLNLIYNKKKYVELCFGINASFKYLYFSTQHSFWFI